MTQEVECVTMDRQHAVSITALADRACVAQRLRVARELPSLGIAPGI